MATVACVNDACSEHGVVKELAVSIGADEVVRCGGMTSNGPCGSVLEVTEPEAKPA
jgi:hypothetical protein